MDLFSCAGFNFGNTLRIVFLLCVGLPLIRFVSRFFASFCEKRLSQHIGVLVGHAVFYGGILFIGVNVLHEFGFNVTAVLGAAGVIGVAVGFASQTSISNIISGFFLLLERPFSVGDTIKSGDVTGIAESIDLLAVRVRTQDNKLVRIPNETVLKHHLVNLTYYGTRRIDLLVSVPYGESVESISADVLDIVLAHNLFLSHPAPAVLFNKIGQLDYDPNVRVFLSVRVWVAKNQFSAATSVLVGLLKQKFDTRAIVVTVVPLN
jgi:small-conductance mechanosensitive channel